MKLLIPFKNVMINIFVIEIVIETCLTFGKAKIEPPDCNFPNLSRGCY